MPPKIDLPQLNFDVSDAILVVISKDEQVVEINKKGAKILGYPKKEIIGKNWFDNFLPGESIKTMKSRFHKMLNGEMPLEHLEDLILTKDGSERIVMWHNILVKEEKGNIVGTLSSGTDITELKLAEKALRDSEERFRNTVENMIEGYQIIDCGWRYLYINDAAARQGRHSKEELIGHTMMEMYPGIENTQMFSYLKRCMTERVPHQMENEFEFPDGSKGWFELRIEPTNEGILVLSMDITRRKAIEEELSMYRQRLEEVIAERTAECAQINKKLMREMEERRKTEEGMILRAAILDNAKDAIILFNSKGDFVYANRAASKTYGYSHNELLNMNLRHLLQPSEIHLAEHRLRETIAKGQMDLETYHARKDGSLVHVAVRHSSIKTKHGQFIVSVIHDIS